MQCHKVQLPNDDTIHSEVVLEGHFVSSGFAVGSSRIEIPVTRVEEETNVERRPRPLLGPSASAGPWSAAGTIRPRSRLQMSTQPNGVPRTYDSPCPGLTVQQVT